METRLPASEPVEPGQALEWDGQGVRPIRRSGIQAQEAQRRAILRVLEVLETAERVGTPVDEPEGTRGINISDTLALKLADELRFAHGLPMIVRKTGNQGKTFPSLEQYRTAVTISHDDLIDDELDVWLRQRPRRRLRQRIGVAIIRFGRWLAAERRRFIYLDEEDDLPGATP